MQRNMAQMSIDVLNWYMKKKKSKRKRERENKGRGEICMATRKQTARCRLKPYYIKNYIRCK